MLIRSPDELVVSTSGQIALNRRDFISVASEVTAAAILSGGRIARAASLPARRKVVIVTFGGGARDEETFAPEGQRNIPCLMTSLLPRSTFFAQVVNHGILGHYVATTSLATGVYETFNNFTGDAPANPTLFEYFRKGMRRPAQDAWVISPSRGFAHMGGSSAKGYGASYAAGVILPKQLLGAATATNASDDILHLLRDNYEEPFVAPQLSHDERHLQQIEELLNLSVNDFRQHAMSLNSADELSVFVARRVMEQLSPTLLWITLHDIDVAHSGAYSLYIDGIQRTDRLCLDIWQTIESLPEYRSNTTMFILPDFGRDSDTNPGGNGFQHHRTGDALSRTTWMMALGPGIREGAFVQRPVDSLDLVPTVGRKLGFDTGFAKGSQIAEVL
ncbi:MAG: hypothetical protein ACXWJB_09680 [Limisphaerales bacterium]